MIASRSDYDFVTIDQPLIVDGGVMPIRTNKNILRAEDVAFGLEAEAERINVTEYSRLVGGNVDRQILGSRWERVVQGLRICGNSALNPGVAFAAKKIYDSNYQDIGTLPTIISQYPECKFDTSVLKGDETAFAYNSPIRKQPILDIFDDIKALTCFGISKTPSYQSSAFDRSEIIHQSFGWKDVTSAGGYIAYESLFAMKWDGSLVRTAQSISTAQPGAYFVTKNPVQSVKYIDKAWIVFMCRQEWIQYMYGSTQRNWKYYTFWEEATVSSDGRIAVPWSSFWSHLQSCVNTWSSFPSIGIVPAPIDHNDINQIRFSLSLQTPVLVRMTLGDHTKWWS